MINPRLQGDLGEASAMLWLAKQGAKLFAPLFHSPDYDLIADFDGRLVRVQVKTSTCRVKEDRWAVMLATRGGNRSWSGVAKYFSPTRCDALFALVGDGRCWYIPSSAIECSSSLMLGGPKYAAYEIASTNALALNC